MGHPSSPFRKRKLRFEASSPSELRRQIEKDALRDMYPRAPTPKTRKKGSNRT